MSAEDDWSIPDTGSVPRHDYQTNNGYYNAENPYDPATDYGRRLSDEDSARALAPTNSRTFSSALGNAIFMAIIIAIVAVGIFTPILKP